MESYECSGCGHKGPLDKHLRCESCGSEAVMSMEAIQDTKTGLHADLELIGERGKSLAATNRA